MTPNENTICPLCLEAYKALAQHLKRAHFVINLDERKLLLNLASGWVNIPLFSLGLQVPQHKTGQASEGWPPGADPKPDAH